MCEVCRAGHSPAENRVSLLYMSGPNKQPTDVLPRSRDQLVICESCNKGWHQLCSTPHIPHEIVDSTLPWFCAPCDAKIAASKQPQDVTDDASSSAPWTTGQGVDKGEGLEADKENEYSEAIKREWLTTQPLTVLVGYILSIEKSQFTSPCVLCLTQLPLISCLQNTRPRSRLRLPLPRRCRFGPLRCPKSFSS